MTVGENGLKAFENKARGNAPGKRPNDHFSMLRTWRGSHWRILLQMGKILKQVQDEVITAI